MPRNTGLFFEVTPENFITIFMSGMGLVLAFIIVYLYFYRGRLRENLNERLIHYGFALFMIGFSYYGLIPNFIGETDLISQIILKSGSIALVAAQASLIAAFEYHLKKTKFLITGINLLGIIMIFFLPLDYESYYLVQQYMVIVDYVSIFIFLYLYTKWSPMELKAISSFMTFGFVGIGCGMIISLIPPDLRTVFMTFQLHVMNLLGFIFLIIPLVINPNKIIKAKKYWMALGLTSLGMICYSLVSTLINYFSIPGTLVGIIIVTLLVIILQSIFHSIRMDSFSRKKEEQEKAKVLKMFTRPISLSDDEITVAKEKRLCLVCKNKISKVNFQCPKCDSLYCIKCSEALMNAENSCWVCNSPFDESKPIKNIEKEEYDDLIPSLQDLKG